MQADSLDLSHERTIATGHYKTRVVLRRCWPMASTESSGGNRLGGRGDDQRRRKADQAVQISLEVPEFTRQIPILGRRGNAGNVWPVLVTISQARILS